MPLIKILPTHLVNKIAAGEVIERPASIVKELVENSLDAGASSVRIDLEDGGKKAVIVSDNGSGMDREDLALAFISHATSKIAGDDDLFAIRTMGFRGEALASIASISRAAIRTRQAGGDGGGWQIEASGGQAGQVRPWAGDVGTTVQAMDLFYNTPARRKFLKSTATELGHATEQTARLALPHPRVAFRVLHNGKIIMDMPAGQSPLERAGEVLGREMAGQMVSICPRKSAVAISGLVSRPAGARSSNKWQYFFLNGRCIRDRLLSHALKEAYRGLVDPSLWPAAIIFIEIDPAEVDVNVHPAKVEVRFRDSQFVHGQLLAALKETLNRASLTPEAALAGRTEQSQIAGQGSEIAGWKADRNLTVRADAADATRRDSLRQALADFFKSAPPPQPGLQFGEPSRPAWQNRPEMAAFGPHGGAAANRPAASAADPRTDQAVQVAEWPTAAARPQPIGPAASAACPAMQAIQIHDSYIVAPCEDGVLIVDQHALHERMLYNDLKRRLADGSLAGQRLLIPPVLKVTGSEAAQLKEHAALLGRLGIEVGSFGPDSFAVQSFPAVLTERGAQPVDFLMQVLDMLAEDENAGQERLIEDVLEVLACKAAIKAGQRLEQSEITELLAARDDTEKSSACPHGRPTTVKLSLKELAKLFKRT
ncbi:MAG: DNA mismatch repair endonuclease MutL [Planctomycetes bacterium]|nr:DNA mismatch repair endonuclease MutL [Planctomycetota bacterium]